MKLFEDPSIMSKLENQERALRIDLEKWLEKEQILWAQKSRQIWMLNGERNIIYFHRLVKCMRATNRILKLQNDQGVLVDDYEELERLALDHFKCIYSIDSQRNSSDLDRWLDSLNILKISQDQISELEKPLEHREIFEALSQKEAFNSPGPDGLPPGFFKSYWGIVDWDIVNMVHSFFYTGFLLKKLNESFITLILKVSNPTTIRQFRPISLYNAVYKIISKIFVKRMQSIMQEVIALFQSAFVKGRLISDNTVLAAEFVNFVSKARKVKPCWGVAKINLYKAYDTVH